ncbi:hypothetical protein HWQ46_07630 [Shewanella sp. D64]|uniref:hypothetical protein n=1 Tax=unclassified Shewanella TaxID=196818 RepID=UPI0022BA2786|nr:MULTISPECIES: hypothetical protein [unclassified Shewanella]MEC4725415.1 hypothetical protein [Shewanella sp. D64]MEC4735739.1 hypothetical protein [Shewanella sp. E94]WBJ93288.1 hypothetical protein HWQ47_15130 [Shewanella sp. MTB7]
MSNKIAYFSRRQRLALIISSTLISQGMMSQAYAVDCQGVAPWSADMVYANTTQVTQSNSLYQSGGRPMSPQQVLKSGECGKG